MAETRTPREVLSREKSARAVYVPPSALPTPTPIPGYSFRWVSTATLGVPDPKNMSTRMREGWEPVRAEDHPELRFGANESGNVEVGGLILCKMVTEMVEARGEYFANHTKGQMESVDSSYLRNQDRRMPMFKERESRVDRGSFGKGTR